MFDEDLSFYEDWNLIDSDSEDEDPWDEDDYWEPCGDLDE